jgi:hypothetical protein
LVAVLGVELVVKPAPPSNRRAGDAARLLSSGPRSEEGEKRMKSLFSVLGLAVVAVAVFGAAVGTARSATGAERLPVTCYAFYSDDSTLLNVGILNPESPAWLDLGPPVRTPTVRADGVAVFTPSGQVNVTCQDNPSIFWAPEVSPLRSSTFATRGPAFTGREDAPFQRVRIYSGNATVVVREGEFQIFAHMQLTLST